MAVWRTPTTGTIFEGVNIGDVPIWDGTEWIAGPLVPPMPTLALMRGASSTTRPAAQPEGTAFFDATLKRPIWCCSTSSTGWVDASGAPV